AVQSYFDWANSKVEQVRFADGTVWTSSILEEMSRHVTGTEGADNLSGYGDADIINALGGDDIVNAGANNDIIDGGAGIDTLWGGSGNDVLMGGAGNDALNADDGNDTLDGGAGVDRLTGNAGSDTYKFGRGSGQDTIVDYDTTLLDTDTIEMAPDITPNDITVTRNASNLNLSINGTTDTLAVQSYFDWANSKVEQVRFADGTVWTSSILEDMTRHVTGTEADDTLRGYGDGIVLNGLGGNDNLYGNSGNDILDGGTGADTMAGGWGNDTYIVDNAGDIINEWGNEGTDSVQSSVTYTLGASIENLTLTGNSAINGTSNDLNNTLVGNSAANILNGGTGADTMAGGAGDDTYAVDNVGDVVTEASDEGIDTVQSSITYTLGSNIENLTLTGTAAINGTGNELNNTITGNSYDNLLDGGTGIDTMTGGLGNDTYIVDNVSDAIIENANEGTDTVQSSISYALGANIENLTLTGSSSNNGTGNSLNNILTGNGSDNVLDGGAGADTMTGGVGNDTYIVDNTSDAVIENTNEGTDTVYSSATYTLGSNVENLTLTGSSTINSTGNASNNVLIGNSANNTLTGNAGNDTLDGGSGVDTMVGGLGDDLYIVDNAGDIVTEALNEGTDTVQSTVSYTLGSNVENLILTGTSAINATGNTLNNTLTGNAAMNILDGGAGADTLIGGLGDDTYIIDNIGDIITENVSEGIDTVQSSVTYTLGANVENLTLTGTAAINGTGNTLDNVLTGNSANNTLTGNIGNDTINGGGGVDTMIGGAGNDIYVADNASDAITENANEGTDTVQSSITYTLGNNVENLTLTGTTAINGTGNTLDNILVGNSGINTLTGNAGNDTLDGGAGADTMKGGAGNDIYVVDNTGDIITENANEGTDTVQSSITYTLGSNVENLTLTGNAAINGTGNTLNNVITGNSGANTLSGGTGADTMIGGAGNDIYVVDNTGDVVTENANEGTDTVQSSITYTLGNNVENLTLTGTTAINGTGNTLDNVLTGNTAKNTLTGGAGNDTLSGGTGADTMVGGTGNDTYVVDNTGDVVTENANEGTDTVQSSITYTLGNNVENLTLTGTTAINGTGNTLDNILIGNSGINTLTGNAGNDTLNGGAGADTMKGGTGNDIYVVDNTGDVVTENANEGTDTVQSSITYTLGANVENLTLTGTAAINGTGNTLDNILTGNSANNTLTGNAGNDTLIGGTGNDTLNGGTGNDTYIFNKGGGQDTITDNDSTVGNSDIVQFDVNPLDLIFATSGNNLNVSLYNTTDLVSVQSWYSGTAYQTETFKAANGSHLMNTQVSQLIQAMATFTASNNLSSWSEAIQQKPQETQQVLAQYWAP
ncbi:MAG: hypothetical protein HQL10_12295, partial [Nitrospirae bacterium]|nr:hypothetical protein [Nitrospirota bacterium]